MSDQSMVLSCSCSILFTVHARELLNIPGHGLGLDVSRKSRIRSGGFLYRRYGYIYGMLFIDLLPFTTIYMNEKIEHSIDFVWMLFSWYLQDLFSHSMSAGGGAGWWQGCGRRRFWGCHGRVWRKSSLSMQPQQLQRIPRKRSWLLPETWATATLVETGILVANSPSASCV